MSGWLAVWLVSPAVLLFGGSRLSIYTVPVALVCVCGVCRLFSVAVDRRKRPVVEEEVLWLL